MTRKSHEQGKNPGGAKAPEQDENQVVRDELARLEAEDAERAAAAAPGAVVELDPEHITRLEREVAEWKDRALRSSADFDNYRKRAIKERDEAAGRGAAQVLGRVVEIIDDLSRVAHLDPAATSAEALHEGMLAIERKFLKALEGAGLERIDPMGQPFDPTAHEAVTTMAASGPEADHTVGAVYQAGYRYQGTLLRPARVAVLQWTGEAAAGEGTA